MTSPPNRPRAPQDNHPFGHLSSAETEILPSFFSTEPTGTGADSAETGLIPGMHVGQLIKEMRSSRGMTQQQLAVATGMSVSSIVRVESSDRNQLTRSNATRLLVALEEKRRLSPTESDSFMGATGLKLFVDAGSVTRTRSTDELFTAFLASIDDPAERACFEGIDQLLKEFGNRTVLGALQGVAAGLGAKLQASQPRPGLIVHSAPQIIEDREVRIISAVPTSDPINPSHKKRRQSDGH